MKLAIWMRSLIPGVSRIHHGHARGGILIFLAFAFLLNGFLIVPWLLSSRLIRVALLAAAAACWLLAFYDGLRVAARAEPPREA